MEVSNEKDKSQLSSM